MPQLITTDAQLLRHIPNSIAPVRGEHPLFDRIRLHLDLAEDWVTRTFTSEHTFNTIIEYNPENPVRNLTERLIATEALLRAIPSLDIILTPNGFGIVSTTNLAPASKPRIDRLIDSMLQTRDASIAALLPRLPDASRWLQSEQAEFFGATLFPDLSVVDSVAPTANKWDKYLELRTQLIDLEASLADEWFSHEQMNEFRLLQLQHKLPAPQQPVVDSIKAQLIRYLRDGSFSSRRLADIVTLIRRDPDHFRKWHSSSTAQLFSPPKFQNLKTNAGYFF